MVQRLKRYLPIPIILLFVFLYLFVYHYHFVSPEQVDNLFYVGILEDPSYLNNDFYIQSLHGFTPRFFYAYTLFLINQVFNSLKITVFILLLLHLFFFCYGVYKITLLLFKNAYLSYFTILLILFSAWKTFADYAVIAPFLNNAGVVITISIWAVYFFLKKQYFLSYLLAGIASFYHIANGLTITIIIGLAHLLRLGLKDFIVRGIKKFYFVAFLVPALPSLLGIITFQSNKVLTDNQFAYISYFFRIPWHSYPTLYLPQTIFFLVTIFITIYALKKTDISKKSKNFNLLFLSSILLLLFTLIFTQIIPILLIFKIAIMKSVIYVRFFSLIFIAYLIFRLAISKKGILIRIIIPLLIVLFLISPTIERNILSYEREEVELIKACEWTKENTPKDAIIMTNPYWYSARYLCNRAIVADFRNLQFKEETTFEWFKRIMDLSNHPELSLTNRKADLTNGYNSLTTEQVKELANKYDASYILTPNPDLELEFVYRDEEISVYKI